jgi:Protein of unknown function (DUF3592)
MLAEIWERLRGYDEWVPTQATVESNAVNRTSHTDRYGRVSYTYDSDEVLAWFDASGERHEASFKAPDDSSLYQMIGGEKIAIRYNPANPDEFYLRELLKTRVHTAISRVTVILLFVALVVLGGWLGARHSLR